MKNKKAFIIFGILGSVLLLGVTYAFFNYYKESRNANVVAGDIYFNLNDEMQGFSLNNVFPETIEEARSKGDANTLTFSITGKNQSDRDIYYEILLNEGEEKDGKTRFKPEHLVFDLVEIDGEDRIMLASAVSFDELNDTSIWLDLVEKDTLTSINRQYELRMWLSKDVTFGEGPGIDYTSEVFANSYASVKVAVRALTAEKEYRKVTFNADGGEVIPPYKIVAIGDDYGELPIPAKEGYRFLGWNGKNMLSINNKTFTQFIMYNINTISAGTYKLSGIYQSSDTSIDLCYIAFYNNSVLIKGMWVTRNERDYENFVINDEVNKIYLYAADSYGSGAGDTASFSELMIEEGTVATPYEPYYVTSDVEVTEWNTPMILTAKYEPIAKDLSGNNYDGKRIGVTIVTDESNNKAFSFDGIDDYIEVPTLPSSINWHDGFVVEFKAKWNELGYYSRILDFAESGPINNIITNINDTNDILRFGNYNGSANQLVNIISSPADLQTLHEYKIEYNNSSSEIKIYRDNILINTISHSMTVNNVKRTSNYVGKSNWDNSPTFSGLIYYLKISQIDGTQILWYDANSQ